MFMVIGGWNKMAIINENQLKMEIRRLIKSELSVVETDLSRLWKHLQEIYDRIKIMEEKWLRQTTK